MNEHDSDPFSVSCPTYYTDRLIVVVEDQALWQSRSPRSIVVSDIPSLRRFSDHLFQVFSAAARYYLETRGVALRLLERYELRRLETLLELRPVGDDTACLGVLCPNPGTAITYKGRAKTLRAGDLLMIPNGERLQVEASGDKRRYLILCRFEVVREDHQAGT